MYEQHAHTLSHPSPPPSPLRVNNIFTLLCTICIHLLVSPIHWSALYAGRPYTLVGPIHWSALFAGLPYTSAVRAAQHNSGNSFIDTFIHTHSGNSNHNSGNSFIDTFIHTHSDNSKHV